MFLVSAYTHPWCDISDSIPVPPSPVALLPLPKRAPPMAPNSVCAARNRVIDLAGESIIVPASPISPQPKPAVPRVGAICPRASSQISRSAPPKSAQTGRMAAGGVLTKAKKAYCPKKGCPKPPPKSKETGPRVRPRLPKAKAAKAPVDYKRLCLAIS